jgi:hypothetical protein
MLHHFSLQATDVTIRQINKQCDIKFQQTNGKQTAKAATHSQGHYYIQVQHRIQRYQAFFASEVSQHVKSSVS